jgi:hypothetical protein
LEFSHLKEEKERWYLSKMERDELLCPISFEKFKHPLVLDCGHTIDKTSFDNLTNKKVCPICNSANNSTDRVNWVVVSLLGLNIQGNSLAKTNKRFTAKEAAQIMITQAKSYAENLVDTKIMDLISKQIDARKRILEYDVEDSQVRNELIRILHDTLNYQVSYQSTKLTITW